MTDRGAAESRDARMRVAIGDRAFSVTPADTDAARALLARLEEGEVTVTLRDYGGFEKVGDLPTALPTADDRITTSPGDLVLYQGNQLVCFYGSNTWAYTRLGRADDVGPFVCALGAGDVTLTLSIA